MFAFNTAQDFCHWINSNYCAEEAKMIRKAFILLQNSGKCDKECAQQIYNDLRNGTPVYLL